MGDNNIINLSFEESLSDAVRKHPCVYDKTIKESKDEVLLGSAWTQIALELHIEVDRAKKCYENLKKKLLRRRNDLKKVERFGTSTAAVEKAKSNLKEYTFVYWLIPFTQSRATRTTIPLATNLRHCIEGEERESKASIFNQYDDFVDEKGDQIWRRYEDEEEQKYVPGEEDDGKHNGGKSTQKRKNYIPSKKGTKIRKFDNELEDSISIRMNDSQTQEVQKDDSELFGMFIATELRKLTSEEQSYAKLRINNFLLNLHMTRANNQTHFEQYDL